VGLGAARKSGPWPVYYLCRGIITVSRTFQEIIIAILFVKMFGFGPLAGMITLAFATIGFMASCWPRTSRTWTGARWRRFGPPARAGGRP
jgi:ABC-type phosphate/phosphonate transport system permease subunit